MTLIRRKKTIRGALRDVAIAPFAFLFVLVLVNSVWLILALVLMLFCMWMAREPAADLIPDVETLCIWLCVVTIIAIAATPLAIRDYFSDGGYETIGQPTEGCLDAAMEYARHLIAGNVDGLYSSFSTRLRAEISAEEYRSGIRAITNAIGLPVSVVDLEELAIPEQAFTEPDSEPVLDCTVQIVLDHAGQEESSILLGLNSSASFEITKFQIAAAEVSRLTVH